MDAMKIMRHYLGDTTNARFYIELAENEVRNYLNIPEDEDIGQFSHVIGEVGVLLYKRDETIEKASQNAGTQSESYSEGGVSESIKYKDIESIHQDYQDAIKKKLNTLNHYRRVQIL